MRKSNKDAMHNIPASESNRYIGQISLIFVPIINTIGVLDSDGAEFSII